MAYHGTLVGVVVRGAVAGMTRTCAWRRTKIDTSLGKSTPGQWRVHGAGCTGPRFNGEK